MGEIVDKEQLLSERVQAAQADPDDYRNSEDYFRIFEALNKPALIEEEDRKSLVDYAAEQAGLSEEDRQLSQYFAAAHQVFGILYPPEYQHPFLTNVVGPVIIGAFRFVDVIKGKGERWKPYTEASKYFRLDREEQEAKVQEFYDKVAPILLDELGNGLSKEYEAWLASRED